MKKCPWCDVRIKWPDQPGRRASLQKSKWFQFTPRAVPVCSHCNNPVKPSPKSQLWLLLGFPFLIASILKAIYLPTEFLPAQPVWLLAGLMLIGGCLAALTSRLEKGFIA